MADRVKELEARLRELEELLAAQGIRASRATAVEPEERPDYVPFGSPQHAALLGLVEVGEDEDVAEITTYTSPNTAKTYRLLDEYEPARTFPAMDPEKSGRLLLKQKVGSLESGQPPIPEGAPSLWQPRDMP